VKELFIYFFGGQDPELSIQAYEDKARQVASSLSCRLIVRRVDVSTASSEQKQHWNGGCTIECVTVLDGAALERTACTPLPAALDPLIRNLCLE
jgi:hypothetical protein